MQLCVCGDCGSTIVEGEGPAVAGTCKLCQAMKDAIAARERVRRRRQTAARIARGFGPAPEGVDVFDRFRED